MVSDSWPTLLADTETARLDLDGCPALVVVVAHPDDETLGAGGLISAAVARGIPVQLTVATDGEASHPHSPTHDASRLAALRREELQRAVGQLGRSVDPGRLGLPDGGLADRIPELTEAVAALLDRSPGAWVVSTWSNDGHPDHDAVGTAAARAAADAGARHLQFPIWGWEWTTPGDRIVPIDRLVALPLTPDDRARKSAALAEYRSQRLPLSDQPGDEAIVPHGVLDRAGWPTEYFVAAPTKQAATPPDSLSAGFFADVYADQDDPYGLAAGSWYERRKRAITMAALPRERFGSAFEPGCSVGLLTAELADRCDRLLAADTSERAVSVARQRLAGREHVRIEHGYVPADWPSGKFDLIVVSELGYYLSPSDLATLVDMSVSALTGDGVLLTCHWRRPVAFHPVTAAEVHRSFADHPRLKMLADYADPDFLLNVLVRPDAPSVAQSEHLA